MFPKDLFAYVLELLAEEVASRDAPAPAALKTDAYTAKSAMQKAIRRGMTELALSAAANLIVTDRRALWRRLLVTALEDLGVGEADLLARIVCASRDRAWRQTAGGEWRVVAHLVTQCCEGSRDQSANDLWNIAVHDPVLDPFKADLCDAELPDLLAIMTDETRPADERAVTILLALGENAGLAAPTHIRADPGAIFAAFEGAGRYSQVAAIYAEAFRLSRLALAPLGLALWSDSQAVQSLAHHDDALPPVNWIGDIPSFVWDQYTRVGATAIRRFAFTSLDWREFAERWQIARPDWTKAAGELLFRAEGARVTRRRTWDLGQRLYERSATLGCFMLPEAVAGGMALFAAQLPHIDRLRAGLLKE